MLVVILSTAVVFPMLGCMLHCTLNLCRNKDTEGKLSGHAKF
jgi:hypothetical protein